MKTTMVITKQWQLHIPKKVREAIGLERPTTVEVEARKGKIIIVPKKGGVMDKAGKYKRYARGKKINLDNIRDYIDYSQS